MADENPILNNPYEEPVWHYATNLQGELDYSRPIKGRRVFTPEVQTIPVRQGVQGDLMELDEISKVEHGDHVVNLLRREVITIRDRLGVLRVDVRSGVDAEDYYHVRYLVPETWRKEMPELNKRLVITNYHQFEPKTLQGNKRSPMDGKFQADGTKQEAVEDYSQVIGRLLGNFRPGSRLLVINDEAHHCYNPADSANWR